VLAATVPVRIESDRALIYQRRLHHETAYATWIFHYHLGRSSFGPWELRGCMSTIRSVPGTDGLQSVRLSSGLFSYGEVHREPLPRVLQLHEMYYMRLGIAQCPE
jgi:hypothetical protein